MLKPEELWDETDVVSPNGLLPSSRCCYLSAAFFGAAGRNAYFVAASWVLVDADRQAGSIAVFLTVTCMVEFFTSGPAGYFADRIDRRLLCILCDIARSLIVLCVGAGLLFGRSDLVLYTSVAVYSIVDRIYLTAMPAIVPSLVREDGLLRFNASSYVGMQAGNMVAAAIAGLLLNVLPSPACFLVAAAAFILSLISMAAVGKTDRFLAPLPSYGHGPVCLSPGERRRLPVSLVLAYALTYTMGMLISILVSVFVLQELSGNALHFGLLEAGWSLGAIVGAALLTVSAFNGADGRAISPIVALMGIVLAALFVTRAIDLCLAQIFLLGAGYNVARVIVEAELQQLTPNSLLGRAKGELHLICTGVGLALYLLLVVAGKSLLPSTLFLAYGAVMITSAIIPCLAIIRRKLIAAGVRLT